MRETQLSATRQIESRRGQTGSMLFANPVEQIRSYFSPTRSLFPIITAGTLAAGKGAMLFPTFFLPTTAFRGAITGYASNLMNVPREALMPQLAAGVLGAGMRIGPVPGFISEITDASQRKQVMKVFRAAAKQHRWSPGAADQVVAAVNKAGVGVGILPSAPVHKSIVRYIAGLKAGAVTLPVVGGIMAGSLAARAVDFAFKAGMRTIEFAAAKAEHISSLEFGGTLGAGYHTQAAATERQRALQAIQRHHLGGRRSLGAEASNYHAIT